MVSFLSLLSPFAHRSRRNMADTQQLVNILGSTLSPDPTTRRTAERELTQLQSQPSFAQVILQLAQDANTPKAYRQAAVVNFKGWIRANYGVRLSPLFSLSFLSLSNVAEPLLLLSCVDRRSSYSPCTSDCRPTQTVRRTNHDQSLV